MNIQGNWGSCVCVSSEDVDEFEWRCLEKKFRLSGLGIIWFEKLEKYNLNELILTWIFWAHFSGVGNFEHSFHQMENSAWTTTEKLKHIFKKGVNLIVLFCDKISAHSYLFKKNWKNFLSIFRNIALFIISPLPPTFSLVQLPYNNFFSLSLLSQRHKRQIRDEHENVCLIFIHFFCFTIVWCL